jgi:hypothetical protein
MVGWALALACVAPVALAPQSASAANRDCHISGLGDSALGGTIRNATDSTLTRVYLEKGAINEWGVEPSRAMTNHDVSHWCLSTSSFGVAMKAEYVTPDGTKFLLEAYKYPFQEAVATCRTEGDATGRYACDAGAGSANWSGTAHFTLGKGGHDRR